MKTEKIEKEFNLSTEEANLFIDDAKRYIKAIKEGRVICTIDKVSSSGMSRTIKMLECSGTIKKGFRYYNFNLFFIQMGYKINERGYFRVNGCGMDMIFHTNYSIINRLKNLGFLSGDKCRTLAQETPSVI